MSKKTIEVKGQTIEYDPEDARSFNEALRKIKEITTGIPHEVIDTRDKNGSGSVFVVPQTEDDDAGFTQIV